MDVAIAQLGIGSPWDALILALSGDASTAALAKGVIAHESQWNPDARNPADPSVGLMQILIGPGGPYPSMSEAALADPATNLTLGIRFLRSEIARYGATSDAIAAYNAGTPRKNAQNQYVNSRGDSEVQAYVDDVQLYWVWYLNNDPLFVTTDASGAEVPIDGSVVVDSAGQLVPAAVMPGLSGAAIGVALVFLLVLAARRWL